MVHSMNTSIPLCTACCWSVRIISRPVRSPTWASRAQRCPPNGRCEISPSFVRSKSAPQTSSSYTRSGASCAFSWAIRQLLSILPPRIVSRKWTCQLSSGYTFPRAAAMPPSAITVCALPSSDLQTSAVLAPCAEASMAARSPAPPAPTTTTSNSCVSYSAMWSEPRPSVGIANHIVRHKPDIQVSTNDPHQAAPCPKAVIHVPGGDAVPESLAGARPGGAGEAVESTADEVPEGVTGEGVHHEQEGVDAEEDAAQAAAKAGLDGPTVDHLFAVIKAMQGADPEQGNEDERAVHEEAVQVLEDEREALLAAVLTLEIADGAGGRREQVRPV